MGGGGSAPKPQPAPEQAAVMSSVSAKSSVKDDVLKKSKKKFSLDSTLMNSSVFGNSNNKLGS